MLRWMALMCLLAATATARSQPAEPPLIVVLESADPRVRAVTVRQAISELGLPAVSLLDARARAATTTATLVIDASGRAARLHLLTSGGTAHVRYLRAGRRADAMGRWLAGPIAQLTRRVRALEARSRLSVRRVPSSEVLDPWGDLGTDPSIARVERVPLSEVLDPWSAERREHAAAGRPSSLRMLEEVLDPWATLPVARTRSGEPALVRDIIDPWTSDAERGSGLAVPRPRQR